MERHEVMIVGAGPGDPELVTRAGWKALQQAEVILYDALLDVDGFHEANPGAQWIAVGKRAGVASTEQAFIGRLLVNLALQGKKVVRLKGGDPSIFGRLREELDALHSAGIGVRIIPGVTAASSTAASLQISLTERQLARSVSFLTPAHAANGKANDAWVDTVLNSDTSVLYMASRQRQQIAQTLISKGMSTNTPVALVENACGNGVRQVMDLGMMATIDPEQFDGPVCLIIGEVAGRSRGAQRIAHAEQAVAHSTVQIGHFS